MHSNKSLRNFIKAEFNIALNYSNIQPEVNFFLANEIISEAKTIRKNIIHDCLPAWRFKASKDGRVRQFNVITQYNLKQCIKIVIGARYFYMSYENLKKYMSHV